MTDGMPFERAAIIGLGLMGGSLARDLAARGVHVRAYDTDPASIDAAMGAGVVQEAIDASFAGPALVDADLVVLAVPVDAAIRVLRRIAANAHGARLVTDLGSTKRSIVAEATALGLADRFVGSHPLCGDHRSGWASSRACLFVDALVYMCPCETEGQVSDGLVHAVSELWQRVGARTTMVSADEHDRRLGWSSHLPHVVSTTLALALARAGVPRDQLGPGGRDVTRLAGSSPDLWTAIACENAQPLAEALAAAEGEIASFKAFVLRGDADAVHQRFATARAWFDA